MNDGVVIFAFETLGLLILGFILSVIITNILLKIARIIAELLIPVRKSTQVPSSDFVSQQKDTINQSNIITGIKEDPKTGNPGIRIIGKHSRVFIDTPKKTFLPPTADSDVNRKTKYEDPHQKEHAFWPSLFTLIDHLPSLTQRFIQKGKRR
jgi:hypothetical protein